MSPPGRTLRGHGLALGSDFLKYGTLDALSRSVGLILLPLLTRVLTKEEYGAADILVLLSTLASVVMVAAIPSAISRYYYDRARAPDPKRLVMTVGVFVLILSTVLGLLGLVAAEPLALLLLHDAAYATTVGLAFLHAALTAVGQVPLQALRMERRIGAFSIPTLGRTLGTAIAVIAAVTVLDLGVLGFMLGQVVGAALGLLLGLVTIRDHLGAPFDRSLLSRSLGYSLPLLPARFVTWFNSQVDRILILTFLGLGAVGLFGAAVRLATPYLLLGQIFRNAWQPYAMRLLTQDSQERDGLYRTTLTVFSAGYCTVALAGLALAPEIIGFALPPDYYSAIVVLPWFIGAQGIHAAASITNLGVILSERSYINSIVAAIGAAANVSLGIILIPRFGLQGAAVGGFVAAAIFTLSLYGATQWLAGRILRGRAAAAVLALYTVLAWFASVALPKTSPLDATLAPRLIMLVAACAILWGIVRASLRKMQPIVPAPTD